MVVPYVGAAGAIIMIDRCCTAAPLASADTLATTVRGLHPDGTIHALTDRAPRPALAFSARSVSMRVILPSFSHTSLGKGPALAGLRWHLSPSLCRK